MWYPAGVYLDLVLLARHISFQRSLILVRLDVNSGEEMKSLSVKRFEE